MRISLQKVCVSVNRIPRERRADTKCLVVVDAVLSLDQDDLNEKLIGIKKITGGALQDSLFVNGVAFKKTFSYAGFEQQPKSFKDPKIVCLNVELELKSEKDNAEVRVEQVSEYQAVVDAEWQIIYNKMEEVYKTGAKVVLSKLPIGDLATQYISTSPKFFDALLRLPQILRRPRCLLRRPRLIRRSRARSPSNRRQHLIHMLRHPTTTSRYLRAIRGATNRRREIQLLRGMPSSKDVHFSSQRRSRTIHCGSGEKSSRRDNDCQARNKESQHCRRRRCLRSTFLFPFPFLPLP